MRWLLFFIGAFGLTGGAVAQLDTIRMASFGGPAEDAGLHVLSLGEGDALVSGYTDSNDLATREPWAVRLDSNLQVVWQHVVPLEMGGAALGSILLPDGSVVIVSRELLSGAEGYGVRWDRLNAETGDGLGHDAWVQEGWILPHGIHRQGDTLVTWCTDYSSGTAKPSVLLSQWTGAEHEVIEQLTWGQDGLSESLSAGVVAHDRMWMASNERPSSDSSRTRIRQLGWNGEVTWTSLVPATGNWVESTALSVVDSVVLVAMAREQAGAAPMPLVARMDTSGGSLPLVIAPANPAQPRAVLWNPPEINALFRTTLFGLGQGDMIFVRMTASGQFLGAMTFGWPESEEPAAMMKDDLGAVWLVGSTQHPNPNVHVVRSPNDDIGDHILVQSDTVFLSPLSLDEPPIRPALQAAPNPAVEYLDITGVPCLDWTYVAFNLSGMVVDSGSAERLHVAGWARGTYLIDVRCGNQHYPLRVLRW